MIPSRHAFTPAVRPASETSGPYPGSAAPDRRIASQAGRPCALTSWRGRQAIPIGSGKYCRPVLSDSAFGSVDITALATQSRPVRVIAPPFLQFSQTAHPADHESNSIRVGVRTSHQGFVSGNSRLKRSRSEARSHGNDQASDSASRGVPRTKAETEADRRNLHPEAAAGQTRPHGAHRRSGGTVAEVVRKTVGRPIACRSRDVIPPLTMRPGRHTSRPFRAPDRIGGLVIGPPFRDALSSRKRSRPGTAVG